MIDDPGDMIDIARVFTAGFDGTRAPAELLALIESGLGGVILFSRNIESPEQTRMLIGDLKRAAPDRHSLVVSIDQEGGRVARLRGEPWADIPPMRVFGALPRQEGIARGEHLGRLLACELRAVGIDLDFAPVLDVDTNSDNPVIGDRAFSSDPRQVADLGVAFIDAMQAAGVAACGKHFPGHGDTEVDSHVDLPRQRHGRQRLNTVELVPFRAASRAGVAAMMSAHLVCQAIDPELPATLSRAVLDVLRSEMGFTGAIVSDDLEMGAIARDWSVEQAAVRALAAGCDQLLVCRNLNAVPRAIAAVDRSIGDGILTEDRVRDAAARWNRLAQRYVRPAAGPEGLAWLVSPEHRAAVAAVLGDPA